MARSRPFRHWGSQAAPRAFLDLWARQGATVAEDDSEACECPIRPLPALGKCRPLGRNQGDEAPARRCSAAFEKVGSLRNFARSTRGVSCTALESSPGALHDQGRGGHRGHSRPT